MMVAAPRRASPKRPKLLPCCRLSALPMLLPTDDGYDAVRDGGARERVMMGGTMWRSRPPTKGTGFGFVFIRYAEIKTLYKIMFLLGYLPLYEYSVVSRCYALSLFLIFLFCALYKKRESRYVLIGLCLAFLANSNVYGAIMAIG